MLRNTLQKQAGQIFYAGAAAMAPGNLVQQQLTSPSGLAWIRERRLVRGRLFLIAAGKAARPMVAETISTLGSGAIHQGIAILPPEETADFGEKICVLNGDYPLPGANSLRAGQRVIDLARQTDEHDIVLLLLSNGAESLLEHLPRTITARHFSDLQRRLIDTATPRTDIFTVNRHLSLVKNGQLASAIWPAWCVALILSDKTGDPAGTIGGGLTATNSSTPADALTILETTGELANIPQEIAVELRARGTKQECRWSRTSNCRLGRTQNQVIGTAREALQACWREAKRMGYSPDIASSAVHGDSRAVGAMIGRLAHRSTAAHPASPRCYLAAGHTSVNTQQHSKTGPAQELALAAAIAMAKAPESCLLSADLGGVDGETSAGGAYAFSDTWKQAIDSNLDVFAHLQHNDAHNFFAKLNGLFTPGPTGSTGHDVMILLTGLPALS